jgi:REP element-mobilizing transposase RayT
VGALENFVEAALMVGTARCAVREMALQKSNTNSRAPQHGVPTKPVRNRLPHEVPLWIDPSKEDYFITICCRERKRNQLANQRLGQALIDTIRHRNDLQIWYAHLAVVMPDHMHMVLAFPDMERRVQTIVSKWKEWTAKSLGIRWQRDFFEHRLRREESFREKADYVLANPVRAGLVEREEDWPYTFIANPW